MSKRVDLTDLSYHDLRSLSVALWHMLKKRRQQYDTDRARKRREAIAGRDVALLGIQTMERLRERIVAMESELRPEPEKETNEK